MISKPPLSQVVLAEDNAADIRLIREALREHQVDCDLQVISDGQEVLALIDRLNADSALPCPDLFLLDLSLPKHSGAEILKVLRASERCGDTPVIVMTSSDWAADRRNAENSGVLHFFQKPCSLGEFMQLGGIVKGVIRGPRL